MSVESHFRNTKFGGSSRTSALKTSTPFDGENLTNRPRYLGNGCKLLLLLTNAGRKSHTVFPLVQKSVTLNDLKA